MFSSFSFHYFDFRSCAIRLLVIFCHYSFRMHAFFFIDVFADAAAAGCCLVAAPCRHALMLPPDAADDAACRCAMMAMRASVTPRLLRLRCFTLLLRQQRCCYAMDSVCRHAPCCCLPATSRCHAFIEIMPLFAAGCTLCAADYFSLYERAAPCCFRR